MGLTRYWLSNLNRKDRLVCREGKVVRMSGISASVCRGQLAEVNVEHMTNKVRDHRRARTTLRQNTFMTCYLSQNGRHFNIEQEIRVFYEESPNPTKVDARKEVLQVEVEDVPFALMLRCVGDNRFFPLEGMSYVVLAFVTFIDLLNAVKQQIGKTLLQESQILRRRLYFSNATIPFRNLEGFVPGLRWLFVNDVGK
jgi:hypothetical protein